MVIAPEYRIKSACTNHDFFIHILPYWITDRERVFFVPKSPQLIVYTLEHCPNCDLLKGFLKKSGHSYSERDLSSAESLTELRLNGVFVNEAPVLQKGNDFYTSSDLFPAGKLDTEHLSRLASGE
jgi:glutaredoxin